MIENLTTNEGQQWVDTLAPCVMILPLKLLRDIARFFQLNVSLNVYMQGLCCNDSISA